VTFAGRFGPSDCELRNAGGALETVGAAVTHYIYDLGGNLIAEADGGTGAASAEYVALEGKPLAYIATGAVYWVHGDHLGTPQMLTDAAAAVVWDASYRPFGEATVTGALAFNLRFPGQYEDAETGLHYNYFRDYDPATGRYIQSDPIGLGGGWNTFAYALGNPVLFVDFMGLEASCTLETRPGIQTKTETGTIYGTWKLSGRQSDGTDFGQDVGNRVVLNCAYVRRVTDYIRDLERPVLITERVCTDCGKETSRTPIGDPVPLGPWRIVGEVTNTRREVYIDSVLSARWRGPQQGRAFSACMALSFKGRDFH